MVDFSKLPQDVLADSVGKGYVGLHIEQGVPILDRDLNLLQDLITSVVRSIVTRYIGNGAPTAGQAFAVEALPAANNFRIRAGAPAPGTFLASGIEVTIPADLNYADQPGVPALTTPTAAQPDPREDTAYLDVTLVTVDGTSDADLLNAGDIGAQTSVRLRPAWTVRVAENAAAPPPPPPRHTHVPLARLRRPRNVPDIQPPMITDLRQTRLNVSEIERRLATMERLLLQPIFDPSPNQFSPKFGGAGQSVTLRGRNFNLVPVQVLFGAVAGNVTTVSPTQVVAQVPLTATMGSKLTIVTTGGTAVSDDTFNVLTAFAPPPNEFSPKSGAAGTAVTLSGTNFNVAPVTVRFGVTVAAIVSTAPGQVVAQVPLGVAGPVKLNVTTGGGSATSVEDFAAGGPPAFKASPDQFNPKFGSATQPVVLSGTNFNLVPVTVMFGATPATQVNPSPTTIATQVPAGAVPGPQKIRVTTAAGTVLSDDNFNVI